MGTMKFDFRDMLGGADGKISDETREFSEAERAAVERIWKVLVCEGAALDGKVLPSEFICGLMATCVDALTTRPIPFPDSPFTAADAARSFRFAVEQLEDHLVSGGR